MKVPASLEIDMCDALRDGHGSPRLVRIIERWFSKHEMVDLTLCGPQCPAYWQGLAATATSKPLCVSMNSDAPTGCPCPVLLVRKETT